MEVAVGVWFQEADEGVGLEELDGLPRDLVRLDELKEGGELKLHVEEHAFEVAPAPACAIGGRTLLDAVDFRFPFGDEGGSAFGWE